MSKTPASPAVLSEPQAFRAAGVSRYIYRQVCARLGVVAKTYTDRPFARRFIRRADHERVMKEIVS